MFQPVAATKHHALGEQVNERLSTRHKTNVMEKVIDKTSIVQMHYSCPQPNSQQIKPAVSCVKKVGNTKSSNF